MEGNLERCQEATQCLAHRPKSELVIVYLININNFNRDTLVHGPPETVLALAGGDVTLPCSFSIKASDDFPTVEWSKEGLKPNVVFLYRNGGETPEMKNPAFRYRTSLIVKELNNGNISLRISNVQLSDAGRYQCMRSLLKDTFRSLLKDTFRSLLKDTFRSLSSHTEPIRVAPGDDVILPCHLEPKYNVEGLTVEWSKPDLQPDPADRLSRVEYVHFYRDGREVLDLKIRSYLRRTELFTDDLKDGNISLRIKNVTLADQGSYRCFIPKLRGPVTASTIQLVVGESLFVTQSEVSLCISVNTLRALLKGWWVMQSSPAGLKWSVWRSSRWLRSEADPLGVLDFVWRIPV
uniref:Ig-like domain-containing protein n=1 Tax=Cyclopterus lumpus TaxID=8103 RepID=A0A8C2XDE2_CYCLU